MNVLEMLGLRRGASHEQSRQAATADDVVKLEVAMRQNEVAARLSALEAEADILVRRRREDE